jgi:hypothetical protein
VHASTPTLRWTVQNCSVLQIVVKKLRIRIGGFVNVEQLPLIRASEGLQSYSSVWISSTSRSWVRPGQKQETHYQRLLPECQHIWHDLALIQEHGSSRHQITHARAWLHGGGRLNAGGITGACAGMSLYSDHVLLATRRSMMLWPSRRKSQILAPGRVTGEDQWRPPA